MSVDLARVTKAYLSIRDARIAAKRQFDEDDAKFKASQEKLEALMLGQLNSMGVESVRTEAGTFYKQEEIKPAANDWNLFYHWIKDHDAFDFLEKRVTKNAVKAYMEEHEGGLPPGVSVYKEYVVRVRRPS